MNYLPLLLCLLAEPVAPDDKPDDPVRRLTVAPAATPSPSLRYRLLPELRDQKPGNAVVHYHRAGLMGTPTGSTEKQLYDLLELPLEDLPKKSVRKFLDEYKTLYEELERAAFSEQCDWQLTPMIRKDGFTFSMPEVQRLRHFANLLKLRMRVEIAEGKLDDALKTGQIGFALANHANQAGTVISSLIGASLAANMVQGLEELMQVPGAPNLYWSLTQLPTPLIDLRKPFQAERLMAASIFLEMGEPNGRPQAWTPHQVEQGIDRLRGLLDSGMDRWGFRAVLAALAVKSYPEGKKLLQSRGMKPEEIEALPMVQVAFLLALHQYDVQYDEFIRWHTLPYWQARPGIQKASGNLRELRAKALGDGVLPLATLLMPAMEKVVFSSVRVDRLIAVLRCLEAVRLYAAAHDGKLPDTLAAILDVPVPLDPVTGQPFTYHREGTKFTLIAPPPPGETGHAGNQLRYEVTIKK